MLKMATKMPGFLSLLTIICLNLGFVAESQSQKNLNKLAAANNELGVNLFHQLTKSTSENIFFSPLSLFTAFAMLFVGTEGNSAEQLRKVLGYNTANLPSDKVPSAFKQYLTKVLPKNEDNAYILSLANEILLSNHFNTNPDYIKKVENFFKAYVKNVDFSGNTNGIIKEVNDWVSQQTHGKINPFLTELSPSTLFLILNAVYFKGTWQTQFNKTLTKDGIFYNKGQDAKHVPFMHIEKKFPYFANKDYQFVELPYKGKDISMIILVPGNVDDGLHGLERKFSSRYIKYIQEALRTNSRTINLALPKFKIGYSREMSSDFEALGAKDIFNPGSADLSGITQSKGLFVNQVIHKAFIEVNEEGSEAAAVTGIIGTRFLKPSVMVNHPFMFMILDKRNSLVLFLGRVTQL